MNSRTPITALSGVGKVKAEAYSRLGINNIGNLLSHYPRGYEDRADVRLLTECEAGRKHSLVLVVATEPRAYMIRRGMNLLKFKAYDESATCEITFFNQNYLKSSIVCGGEYRFWGVVEKKGNKYFMSSPEMEPYSSDKELLGLVPVYPLTEGISRKQITKDITSALAGTAAQGDVIDILPDFIRQKNRLCTLSFALRNIHFPSDFVSLAAARKRLIFDEFFTFAIGLAIEGRKNRKRTATPCPNTDITPLLERLPYKLTSAQVRACSEIATDMSKSTAMSRILVGDVGSGKTVCAAAAMYIAVKNGMQAALMAPTEILARQHFADISELFEPLGISCELLCGSLAPAKKKRIYDALATDDEDRRIDIVIGTHALLSDGVSFYRAGLVVTDEQHRFGVSQRSKLSEKSEDTHMLVMSATPIPRTLALAVYGDLDVSKIDEMPPGRQKVDTFAVDESYRERLDAFIKKQVDGGGQVYVVCPSIEEDDEEVDIFFSDVDGEGNVNKDRPKLKAAVPYTEELKKRLPELRIEFMHGKLKSIEKDKVMLDFAAGKIDVLVSTTVIEVGVNVPNASLMIVENAERFGLSQLHQLRGRVGRGKRKSYCVLVSESVGKENSSGDRLKTMCSTYNGYEIAEKDLVMRGPGDFIRGADASHVRQSGGLRFKLAELCDDTGLLQRAFGDAAELVSASAELKEFPELRAAVDKMFSFEASQIN